MARISILAIVLLLASCASHKETTADQYVKFDSSSSQTIATSQSSYDISKIIDIFSSIETDDYWWKAYDSTQTMIAEGGGCRKRNATSSRTSIDSSSVASDSEINSANESHYQDSIHTTEVVIRDGSRVKRMMPLLWIIAAFALLILDIKVFNGSIINSIIYIIKKIWQTIQSFYRSRM